MKAHKQPKISVEEYIQLERESDTRFEYHDGDIFALAGGELYFDIEGLG
jgi:Uma2 family endonuclease